MASTMVPNFEEAATVASEFITSQCLFFTLIRVFRMPNPSMRTVTGYTSGYCSRYLAEASLLINTAPITNL